MKKSLSIFLSIIFLLISFSGVLPAIAYFSRLDFVTQKLNLSVTGGMDNTYISIASANINYYTYNGTENVLIHSQKVASLGQSITIWGEAKTEDNVFYNNDCNFIGWSATGLCESNGNNAARTFVPGETVSVSTLQAAQGFLYTAVKANNLYEQYGEVHLQINLYDIYDKNELTIQQHPNDPVDDEFGYSVVRLNTWDSLEALENQKKLYEESMGNGDSNEDDTTGDGGLAEDDVFNEDLLEDTEKLEVVGHYKGGDIVFVPTSESEDTPEPFKILFSECGTFTNLESYRVTASQPALTFYFHPGNVYSSTLAGQDSGILSYSSKYVIQENGTNRTETSKTFLYTTTDNVYNDDGSLTKENRFEGGIAPNSDITLYVADNTPIENVIQRGDFGLSTDNSASSGYVPSTGVACFTTGTLITLADGSKIPVEKLTNEHYLRVYDHDLGRYTPAPPLLIMYSGDKLYDIAQLNFADGEILKIINERGLFDITLNKYVYITPKNCKEFVGHKFAKERADGSGFDAVELLTAYKRMEYTGCYSVTSTYYINHFINGYLTVPGGYHWFVNYFEYGENLKYDEQAKARDIAIYGLFTKEDFAPYLPEDMLFLFDVIYPAQYLKVAIGKGLASMEEILTVVQEWVVYYDLNGKLEQNQPQ